MACLLFYSDTHLRSCGSFAPYNQLASNGLTKELNNILQGFNFVADAILKFKPLRVGMLGDFYNNTEFQDARTLYASHLALGMIKKACDEVGAQHDMISGNHDMLSDEHNISNIANLVGYGHVHLETSFVQAGGMTIAYVPATDNSGVMFSRLSNAQNNADLICTHADFQGSKYESGMPSDSPLPAYWNVPVISGDIHVPQSFASINFVGSLMQNKFYRSSIEKVGGVLIYDLDTKQVVRLRNTYSKHYIKILDGVDTEIPPPEACILQVVSSRPKEEIEEQYKAYEHVHIPAIVQKDGLKVNYSHFSLDNPEKLLRLHVNKERPDAMEVFEEVVGK